ncbi:lipid IV(A) palmitoyltransferase PagP [Acerihabitans arboris]|uniref:Lipid A acyltransferase PagP n=1 Tax=Acerihabitans arboris TaxID=2691583 RepID=A0A845SRR2_9GAMM|nr:lipid IV(A) palmitoyltransferase PagP [Acerihabitans arboris]NDL65231.1 lipid IV(A) palmitoyltransferase PagP [Acerihabitans arboris]
MPARDNGLWRSFTANVAKTWHASPDQDIYLPAISWHNRYFYSDEHIRRYNERPWGAGYGVSRLDERDNWHALYMMAFKDSFNRWEPFAGYAWESRWRPLADKAFRVGAGFTLGVTARHNWGYYPIPAVLPLASVSYQKFTFQGTYIPGTRNNGNVFFAWLRWQI